MKEERQSPLGIYTIGIAALFLAGFFLLVVFGAQCYRNTVAEQNDNMHSRTLLSYLSTTVKGYDSADSVQIQDSEYGQVLVIAEPGSGYALRLYRYKGNLVEDYAPQDAALNPQNVQVIGATARFAAVLDQNFLRVETDAGRVLLRLRSEGGSAA